MHVVLSGFQSAETVLAGVVGDRVASDRCQPLFAIEEAHLKREHVGAGQRFTSLVEHVSGDECRMGKDEVGAPECLRLGKLDWTSWLARSGLAVRHAQIPRSARVERVSSGGQLADFEAAKAIRAGGPAFGD